MIIAPLSLCGIDEAFVLGGDTTIPSYRQSLKVVSNSPSSHCPKVESDESPRIKRIQSEPVQTRPFKPALRHVNSLKLQSSAVRFSDNSPSYRSNSMSNTDQEQEYFIYPKEDAPQETTLQSDIEPKEISECTVRNKNKPHQVRSIKGVTYKYINIDDPIFISIRRFCDLKRIKKSTWLKLNHQSSIQTQTKMRKPWIYAQP